MNQDQERVIRIVKKLYALANGSDGEESQAAAEKAQKLCAEYNLTVSAEDLSGADAGDLCREHSFATAEYRQHRWMAVLCGAINDAFSCDAVVSRSGAGRVSYTLIGVEPDVSVALHTFIFLYRIVKSGKWGNAKQTNAWRIGFVTEVHNRLQRRKRETLAQGSAGALVLVKEAAIASYMTAQFPNLGKPRRYRQMSVDAQAFGAGVRAGREVALNDALKDRSTSHALA